MTLFMAQVTNYRCSTVRILTFSLYNVDKLQSQHFLRNGRNTPTGEFLQKNKKQLEVISKLHYDSPPSLLQPTPRKALIPQAGKWRLFISWWQPNTEYQLSTQSFRFRKMLGHSRQLWFNDWHLVVMRCLPWWREIASSPVTTRLLVFSVDSEERVPNDGR